MKLKLTMEVETEIDETLGREHGEKLAIMALRRAMNRASEKLQREYEFAFRATSKLTPASVHVDGDAHGMLEVRETFR